MQKKDTPNPGGVNQYADEVRDNKCPQPKTAERLAEQFGVHPNTVKNAAKYADAVDAIGDTYGDKTRTSILTGEAGLEERSEKSPKIYAEGSAGAGRPSLKLFLETFKTSPPFRPSGPPREVGGRGIRGWYESGAKVGYFWQFLQDEKGGSTPSPYKLKNRRMIGSGDGKRPAPRSPLFHCLNRIEFSIFSTY